MFTKQCTLCNEIKDLNQFCKNKKFPDGLSYWCRICNAKQSKLWRTNNPEKKQLANKRKGLWFHYKLTLDDFNQMLKLQNGVCAICEQPETAKDNYSNIKRLSVDHCHKTNKIRGLLCDACNRAEGFLRSDVEVIRRLADYVEKHSAVE
jgi:hypothetical protein